VLTSLTFNCVVAFRSVFRALLLFYVARVLHFLVVSYKGCVRVNLVSYPLNSFWNRSLMITHCL
jgi:hypothetical protein